MNVVKINFDATMDVAFQSDGSAIKRRIAVMEAMRILTIAVSFMPFCSSWAFSHAHEAEWMLNCFAFPFSTSSSLFILMNFSFHSMRSKKNFFFPFNFSFFYPFSSGWHEYIFSGEWKVALPEQWISVSQWRAVYSERVGLW